MKRMNFLSMILLGAAMLPALACAQSQDSRTVYEYPGAIHAYRDEVIPVQNHVIQTQISTNVVTNDGLEALGYGALEYDGIREPLVTDSDVSSTTIVHSDNSF